ncbi:MAG TPA: hypothetical protein DCE42_17765 [Myxococcales bacterium]|nr:hypothetical protein [Deltaproteobacteria bacterium]MBU54203.1 hypothetical protein [Deltaproteobacteria bacterium]HAA56616.1 hypothetical protein [Myxococcales bacterium]
MFVLSFAILREVVGSELVSWERGEDGYVCVVKSGTKIQQTQMRDVRLIQEEKSGGKRAAKKMTVSRNNLFPLLL